MSTETRLADDEQAENIERQTVRALAPTDPLSLLQTLIDKGADPDKLGKMIDLAERWQAQVAKAAFAQAMNACQKEMPVITKDASNNHNQSLYVRLESLQSQIVPVYTKHGFSVSWSQGEAPQGMTRVLATLFHTGGHSQAYQGDYPIDGKGAQGGGVMNALQGTVSAHTYAQRDMLRLMFNITITGYDKDGNYAANEQSIGEEDQKLIKRILDDTGADVEGFLAWARTATGGSNIAALDEIPRSLMPKVLSILRQKKGRAAP